MHWPSFFSWKIETVLFFLAEKEKNGFKKPSALWQLPLREIPDDPALRLLTHRADLPCLLGQHDMAAVACGAKSPEKSNQIRVFHIKSYY